MIIQKVQKILIQKVKIVTRTRTRTRLKIILRIMIILALTGRTIVTVLFR